MKEIRNVEKAQHGIAQNNFFLCNHEPRVLESGIQLKESRIPLTIGIQNPSSFDKDPESTAWDPESKTILHFLRRSDRKERGFLLILLYSRWRNLFFLVLFSSSGGSRGRVRTPAISPNACLRLKFSHRQDRNNNNNNNNNNNFIYIALKSNNCPKRYLITK